MLKSGKIIFYKLVFIIMMFISVDICYAQENYIDIVFENDENTVNLNILITNNANIYGFLGSIEYNQNELQLNGCQSEKFDITVENDILLAESIIGYSNNNNIAICNFSVIKNEYNSSIEISDITLSDGTQVLYNKDIISTISYHKEEDTSKNNQSEEITNPKTGGNYYVIVFILIAITFPSIFIINKKYKLFLFLIIIGIITYPISTYAIDRDVIITEKEITEIRNILIKRTPNNTDDDKYDFDQDKKITINDLIVALIEFNTLNNTDEIAPIINSCTAVIKNNKTIISVETYDKDIEKYTINNDTNLTTTQKEYTINSVVEKNTITAYDKSNNSTTVTCRTYYEAISPSGAEDIKYNVNTETLKVWINYNKRNERTNYYTTHIWVKDAYKQFKSQVPNDFGNELLTAKDLLNNAVSQEKLQNKLVVGVNASGFVLNGYYGETYYAANSKFNKTGQNPIVIVNGNVLRDLSSSLPTNMSNVVYGLNKSGDLTYYSYVGGNNVELNKQISQTIINDGVLNTFAFRPVILYGGTLKSTDTAQNIRQGFCQIDKNNFIFVTDVYNSARNGFSMKELGEYMIELGCKVGFNLDGGGSTSLIFKDRNASAIAVTTSNREIADVIYFHE